MPSLYYWMPYYIPRKRSGDIRVSEQELRFIIMEQLYHYISFLQMNGQRWNVYYSVETPTQNGYSFSGSGERDPENGNNLTRNGINFARFRNITIFVKEYRSYPIMDWGVPGWKRVI